MQTAPSRSDTIKRSIRQRRYECHSDDVCSVTVHFCLKITSADLVANKHHPTRGCAWQATKNAAGQSMPAGCPTIIAAKRVRGQRMKDTR